MPKLFGVDSEMYLSYGIVPFYIVGVSIEMGNIVKSQRFRIIDGPPVRLAVKHILSESVTCITVATRAKTDGGEPLLILPYGIAVILVGVV